MSTALLEQNIAFQTKEDFEQLFKSFYGVLCSYANRFLQDQDASEEVVQEIFVKLWNKKDDLNIENSVKSYLYRAVRNSSLNILKHIEIRDEYKRHKQESITEQEKMLEDAVVVSELEEKIHWAIDQLPPERKKIFMMSRYDGLKYREIAEKLNISIKTVENQMGKAMKSMKEHLKEYLTVAVILIMEYLKQK